MNTVLAIYAALFMQLWPFPGPGRASTSGGCSTLADSVTGTSAGNESLGSFSSSTYKGGNFTAASSYTLCSVTLRLAKVSSPTQTAYAAIYTDNSGVPGTLVGTQSANSSMSGWSASEGDVTFTGMSAAITSGSVYWIILRASAADSSNYGAIYRLGGSGIFANSSNGSTWTPSASRTILFQAYR